MHYFPLPTQTERFYATDGTGMFFNGVADPSKWTLNEEKRVWQQKNSFLQMEVRPLKSVKIDQRVETTFHS